jgi:hypothetical protein
MREIFMKNKFIAFGLAASLASVFGCSKDMNAQDYKDKQYMQDLGKLQAAAGVYRGLLISSQDHRTVLGAIQITLVPRLGSQTTSDGSKTSPRAVMGTNVQFQGETASSVSSPDGVYTPTSGDFEAPVLITPQSPIGSSGSTTVSTPSSGSSSGGSNGGSGSTVTAATETVSIRGNVQGESFIGSIQDDRFPDYGTEFSLTRNGPLLQNLVKQNPPKKDALFSQKSYAGVTTFSNGVKKPVTVVLLKSPSSTPEQNFLNLIIPLKPVSMTFSYGNAADILYSGAMLDQQNLNISGTTAWQRNSQIIVLTSDCATDDNFTTLSCTHSTNSGQLQNVATTNVNLVSGSATNPPDDSSTRDPVIHVYEGKTQLEPKKWTPITLTVVYAALQRIDEILELFVPLREKTVRVTFLIPATQVGATWSTVKFDLNNRSLEGTQPVPLVNRTVNLQISCRNFDFAADKYDFSCTYISDLNNQYLNFIFKKP